MVEPEDATYVIRVTLAVDRVDDPSAVTTTLAVSTAEVATVGSHDAVIQLCGQVAEAIRATSPNMTPPSLSAKKPERAKHMPRPDSLDNWASRQDLLD